MIDDVIDDVIDGYGVIDYGIDNGVVAQTDRVGMNGIKDDRTVDTSVQR